MQSLAGTNRDVIQTMDFLIALILDGKKSHELCKKQSVWKLLLMMECPRHSLKHRTWDCLGGRTQSFVV